MNKKVNMKNKVGAVKQQKVGISWTTLFFGGFVQIFRSNWSEFFKFWGLSLITFGIWGVIQVFTTNKKEVIRLTEMGYEPANEADRKLLINKNIIQ